MPVNAPAAAMSQSEVLISPVSPLSPKMNRPEVWKLAEMEAVAELRWSTPVMSWLLPVIFPPKVKALICKVPVEEIVFVPPPLKVKPPPDVVTRIESKSAWAARRPLVMSKLPAKEEEPVPEKVFVPYVKKLPDIEATPPKEAVPLVSRSPEISKSLFAEI